MQAILHGVPQKVVALGIERCDEESRALEIVNCVKVVDSLWESGTRGAGLERHFGSDSDYADFFWPILADCDDVVIRSDKRYDETAEQCCAHVVGVPFEVGSET